MKEKKRYIILATDNIRNSIKVMDEHKTNFITVIDLDKKVVGVVTEGDIRRAILNGLDLKDSVSTIANKNYKFLNINFSQEDALRHFQDPHISHLPVLDDGKLIDILPRKVLLAGDHTDTNKNRVAELSVVIMAGGKGTRLDPFTRILPKSLIPIGNEPAIKVIMDEFCKFGMTNFYVALNDKGKMVKAYFHDHDYDYKIQYIEEKKPLGTAGALKFLENKMKAPFFVSNCDIIIHTDYASIFDFHKKGSYALTLVGSMQHYTIPYGVCDIDNGGILKDIREKPEYDFLVNTGFYLLEPFILDFIPKNKKFDMTDLINAVKARHLKVGVYPVSRKSWIDVGQWAEYKNMLNGLNSD